MAEPYIQARLELYKCYIYLVMRCSLWKGGYALVTGSEVKERTDFTFLLEQAKWLLRGWCVMEEPDGNKRNEMFWGYEGHFGFHFYGILSGVGELDVPGNLPVDRPASLTDEGNVKWNAFKKIYVGHMPLGLTKKAEEEAQPDEDGIPEGNCSDEGGIPGGEYADGDDNGGEDDYGTGDSYADEEDYEYDYEDDYDAAFAYDDLISPVYDADAEYEYGQQQAQKQADIEYLRLYFEHQGEYIDACNRFIQLFGQAKPDVLRGFCKDLEEIVALYLVERGIPPLADIDKALNVYGGIYDGPFRQAERYARGAQWQNL